MKNVNEQIVEIVMRSGVHRGKPIDEIFKFAEKEVHQPIKKQGEIPLHDVKLAFKQEVGKGLAIYRITKPLSDNQVKTWVTPFIPLIS